MSFSDEEFENDLLNFLSSTSEFGLSCCCFLISKEAIFCNGGWGYVSFPLAYDVATIEEWAFFFYSCSLIRPMVAALVFLGYAGSEV